MFWKRFIVISLLTGCLFAQNKVELSNQVKGTLASTHGGTDNTTATDDAVLVGNGAVLQLKTLANCVDTAGNHLNYDSSTNTFSCGTSSGAAGTVTTTGSPANGNLTKFSGATSITNGNLSGDVTTSGTLVATVVKVNGVSFTSSPSTNTVPVITASNTASYQSLPNCTDSSGQHLNYNTSTNAFSCGSTNSAGSTSADNNFFLNLIANGPRTDFSVQTGTSTSGFGLDFTTTGTSTFNAGSTTEPPYRQQATTTTNASTGSIQSNVIYRAGSQLIAISRNKSTSTTNVQWCVGFTDSNNCTDTNNGLNVAQFTFSTTRGDTKIQCAVNNGSGNETYGTNPVVNADTNWHTFKIVETASGGVISAYDFYIDGVHACDQLTTDFPTSGTLMRWWTITFCRTCTPTVNNIRWAATAITWNWP